MAGDKAIANPKLEGEFYKGNIPYKESQEVHSADDILLNAMGPRQRILQRRNGQHRGILRYG